MTALSDDLRARGLVHQLSDEAVLARLDGGGVTAYTGFDPTADSLHVGHLLPIFTLRRLQESGNAPIVVAGGATGGVGDPSGKSQERNLLSAEELSANVEAVSAQLSSLLDFSASAGSARATLLDNATWLGGVGLVEFLRDVGKHVTVNQMIAKDSVRSRLETRESGISFTEFTYMLLQAYDFVHLFTERGCRLQLGASDQWGNITVGIDLIRRMAGGEAWGMTVPLLLGPDGTKFGKTAHGAVWLDGTRTTPYAMYQFFLNVDDASVVSHLCHLTFLELEEIAHLESLVATRPDRREAQHALARAVTSAVHGDAAVDSAVRAASALFSEDVAGLSESEVLDGFADAPTSEMARSRLDSGLAVVDALVESGLETSRGAARRTITQGGAYVNNRRVTSDEEVIGTGALIAGCFVVLRKGKRHQHLIRFSR